MPHITARRLVVVLSLVWLCGSTTSAHEATGGGQAELEGVAKIPRSAGGVQDLLTGIVRSHIPHSYENHKDWGKTKSLVSGLQISRDGLRIKTKRRRKDFNHGTWKRYRVSMVDPNANFRIRIENYREGENGRATFDLVTDARLLAFGRLSQWQRGVQLISLSAEADSRVQMRVSLDVGLKLDAKRFPPDIQLDVRATGADLRIVNFRLRRISNLSGPLAKNLSSSVREVVERVIERKRGKMVEKINAKIDKSRDRLRLSLSELVGTPFQRATKLLDKSEANAEKKTPNAEPSR